MPVFTDAFGEARLAQAQARLAPALVTVDMPGPAPPISLSNLKHLL
jgi:hypothetical protein